MSQCWPVAWQEGGYTDRRVPGKYWCMSHKKPSKLWEILPLAPWQFQ